MVPSWYKPLKCSIVPWYKNIMKTENMDVILWTKHPTNFQMVEKLWNRYVAWLYMSLKILWLCTCTLLCYHASSVGTSLRVGKHQQWDSNIFPTLVTSNPWGQAILWNSLLEEIKHCLRLIVIKTFQVDNSPRKTIYPSMNHQLPPNIKYKGQLPCYLENKHLG